MTASAAFLAEAKRSAGVPRPEGVLESEAGLVGAELTPLVTTLGSLEAKRLSVSPRWASELARRLHGAGVGEGDVVAASFSGSFPGLDLAVVSACAELRARLVAVSSVTASTWGATEPGFTWPEMEARLAAAGLVPPASVAVSAGGDEDAALDLDPGPRALAKRIAGTSAAALGAELLAPSRLEESIARRLELYVGHAGGRPVALYVNCGGNQASLGRSGSFLRLRTGFLRGMPFDLGEGRGVMALFAARGVPVLHLLNIRDLALRWGVRLQ
jgi:poly-gamma-glutamate system protein